MKTLKNIFYFWYIIYGVGFCGGFDDLGYSARSVSMGGAGIAVCGNSYGLFYNPSTIHTSQNMSFYTTYSNLFPGIEDDNLSYITLSGIVPISFLGSLGVGGTFLNTDNWKEYTLSGSYAKEIFGGLAVGGTVKFLGWSATAAPGEKALSYQGLTFDAGVIYKLPELFPNMDITAGASVRNINEPSIASEGKSTSAQLPMVAGVGVAFNSKTYDYIFTTDLLKEKDVYSIRTGAEFLGYSGDVFRLKTEFFLRIGYHDIIKADFAKEEGITGGFGLRMDNYRFDYGYEFPLVLQDLGGNHKLSFSFNL